WTWMPCNAHGTLLFYVVMVWGKSMRRRRKPSMKRVFATSVIAGLDPAIHPFRKKFLRRRMDPRVKPAGDVAGSHAAPAASLARGLHELPDWAWRERKLGRFDAKRTQRVRHSVGHHSAGGDDAALAGAFGAQRIDRRGVMFLHDGADIWKIAGRWDEVIGERAGQQLAVLIVDEMFHHGAAEPLHHRADGLPVYRQGIDDTAAIRDHHVVDEFDVTELGIDRHVRGMGAVRVSVLLVEKGAVGGNAGARELAQGERLAAGTDRLHAVHNLD